MPTDTPTYHSPHYSVPAHQHRFIDRWRIDFFHVDHHGKLTITNLLNFMQETAWRHANNDNYGYVEMQQQNLAWVISNLNVKIGRLPGWGEEITIETWVRPPHGPYIYREFSLRDQKRNLIAAASVCFIIIDTKSRRLKLHGFTAINPMLYETEQVFDEDSVKIVASGQNKKMGSHTVKYSDLDLNQHVNNSKYIEWVYDYLPQKWAALTPCSTVINYKSEALLGKKVILYIYEQQNSIIVEGVDNESARQLFVTQMWFRGCV